MGLESLAIGGSMASGGLNAFGSRAQAQAAQKAAEINARNITTEASATAARTRKSGRQILGKARADFGQSGLQMVGSPLELMAQNAAEVERQAMEETLAGQYAANVERSRGDVAASEGRRVSIASLLEGGTKAAYYGYRFRG